MKSLKKVGVLFTLLITTLAMVGCASTTTEEKSTAMKTVQTDKGEVEIPENPKRIISDYYLGEFLAVGVKPIIASPYALNNPYLKDDIEGIEPTVYIQDGKRSDDETFEYIASLVGKEKEAKDYIEQFLQKAEEHKQEIQDIVKDQTVSIVEVWPQQIYTMGSHFARGGRILYDLWDLKAPEKIQKEMVDGDKQYEVVSLEALPEYAGDFVLYGVLDGTDPAFVTSSNLWNSLPAVKNGKTLPYEQVSFMHRDPITQSKQLEIFIDFFEQFKE